MWSQYVAADWCLGLFHMNVPGNESADEATKQTANSPETDTDSIPASYGVARAVAKNQMKAWLKPGGAICSSAHHKQYPGCISRPINFKSD